MEYVFCDTGKELKETYEFIDKLEAYLNAHVIRLPKELPGFSESYDFDHFVELFNGYLPSPSNRWCTKKLKLGPFEHYIGDDTVKNYVGIRADEARVGYISTKPNVETIFPFIEDGIDKDGVLRILEDAGIGLPIIIHGDRVLVVTFVFIKLEASGKVLRKNIQIFLKKQNHMKRMISLGGRVNHLMKLFLKKMERKAFQNTNSSPLLVDILSDDDKETVYENHNHSYL